MNDRERRDKERQERFRLREQKQERFKKVKQKSNDGLTCYECDNKFTETEGRYVKEEDNWFCNDCLEFFGEKPLEKHSSPGFAIGGAVVSVLVVAVMVIIGAIIYGFIRESIA